MKQQFKVFKQGVTDKPIVILSNPNEPTTKFNKVQKIAKYKYLGYTVTDLKNNPL